MKWRTIAIVLVFMGSCMYVGLQAQTHPCDVVPPSNPQMTSPIKGAFCHAGLTIEGSPTIITRFKVYIDGQLVFDGLLTPIGPATADGRSYFETPPIVIARGDHVATFSAESIDGEGPQSAPYPFGVVGAVPAAPTNGRVKK